MAKRIDVATLPVLTGTLYPSPFDEPCRARRRTRLAGRGGADAIRSQSVAPGARRVVEPAPLAHRTGRVHLRPVGRGHAGDRD